MASSPFHGIFSSLSQGDSSNDVFSFGSPASAKQKSHSQSASGGSTIGKVAVDIYEQDDYYIVKAPIAGVRLADLDIEVHENILTIRGNRKQTDDIPEQKYYLQECFWGPFSRSITLPGPIDARKVKATFNKDCVLKILVPKEEKIKIVRINES